MAAMNDNEMRIAIAEASGWKYVPGEEPTFGGTFKVAHWLSPTGERKVSDWKSKTDINLPDFLSDLNAMHEAEITLSADDADFYSSTLDGVMDKAPRRLHGISWRAHRESPNARQRAEAFLRTLNLYKE